MCHQYVHDLVWLHACIEYKEMQQAGVSVFAPDAAGFGKSEPSEEKYRCYVADVDHFADDIYAFRKVSAAAHLHLGSKCLTCSVKPQLAVLLQEVVSQHCSPELPVFMGGMSMGGMIAVLTVLRDPSAWKASLPLFYACCLVASCNTAVLHPYC